MPFSIGMIAERAERSGSFEARPGWRIR